MATRKTKVKKKMVAKKVPASAKKTPVKKDPVKKAPVRKVVAKKVASAADTAMKLAGVGSEAVMKATGRAWEQWLVVLDKAGAMKMPHKSIADMVYKKFGVPGWWAQMVTVGYEQARGLRGVYEKADGFAASASKTMNANLSRVYDAWHDSRLRDFWLPGAPLEVRRSTDGKSMRITWTLGNSNVDVHFQAKGADKSTVQVEHSKLSDAEAVAAQKVYWSEGLERLRTWLEGATPAARSVPGPATRTRTAKRR